MKFEINSIAMVSNKRTAPTDDFWGDTVSAIKLNDDYQAEALDGIEDFSHVEIIFGFDKVADGGFISGSTHPRENTAWTKIGHICPAEKQAS